MLLFSSNAVWLCCWALLTRASIATFVVGPEPQPLVFHTDANDGHRRQNTNVDPGGAIRTPPQSIPLQEIAPRRPSRSSSFHDGRFLQESSCNITNTFKGFNFTDNIAENGEPLVPAHPMGAVGVSRLVAVVYSMLEVRQKDGTLLFRDDMQSFFSAFPEASDPETSFFVPRVVYDAHAGRFVIMVMQRGFEPQEVSRIWLAVSMDENPDSASQWYKSYINAKVDVGGFDCYTFPTGLEVDEEVIYITSNLYLFNNIEEDGLFWVIRKGLDGGFYDGGALSFYKARLDPSKSFVSTAIPTLVHGSSGVEGSVGTYFVSIPEPSSELLELQVFTLFNPQSTTPSYNIQKINLGAIHQGTLGSLPDAPQLGSGSLINTNAVEPLDAVWRNSKLWVVFSVNPTSGVDQNQASTHWARFNTSGSALTLEAQGDFGGEDIAAGTHTYYPSVAVNTRGVVAYGYSASSPTTYAGAYASVGTLNQSFTVQSGLAPYVRLSSGRNRWGGYNGISVDPTDDSFWLFNQYAETTGSADENGNGRWGTAWGRLACADTPVPPPVSTPVAPAPVLPLPPLSFPVPPPTEAPVNFKCGLFGLSLFCPFTLCGFFGRLLGLCRFA